MTVVAGHTTYDLRLTTHESHPIRLRRRADTHQWRSRQPARPPGYPPPLGPLEAGQVLYEPDCALIRAGCLAALCRQWQAPLLCPQIAHPVGAPPAPVRPPEAHPAQGVSTRGGHAFRPRRVHHRPGGLGKARGVAGSQHSAPGGGKGRADRARGRGRKRMPENVRQKRLAGRAW